MALGSVKRDKSRHQTKKENRQNTDDKTLKLGQWGFQRVAKSKLTNHIGFPCSLGSSLFWLSWKFSVAIVDTLTSRTVAYWNFPSDSLITVVCPFKFNDSDAGLLVATWNETSKAVLCVFDLMSNRIVRQYNFNQKINCLEIVKDNSLSLERWICRTPPSFHSWQTAVAVGVDEGHVYLIDVCLSSRIEPEKEPNDSTVSALSEDINRTRFVDILAEHHKSNGTFRTQNRYRKVEMLLNEISCTALKFQKQSFILAVGFNFGEFLLFDLTEFMSIYFSNFLKKSIVSGFCFVEPENAIRSTLYCWTFRENLPDRRYRSSMELSKMVFLEKSVDNSETDYQKMCSCNVCFKQTLRKCRKFVSCTHVTSTCTNSNESDSGQLNDSSISCCTYILWLTEKNVVRGHLFDFNAWYRCGMPRRICSGKLSFCPFYTLHIIEPPSKVITANVSRLINGQQNVESRLFSIQLRDIAVRDAVFTEHELCGYACALSATVRVLCKNGMKLYNCQSAPAQEKQAAAVWSIMLNERRVIFLMKFLVDVTELQARKQFLEWIWDTCVMIKHELADFCNRHLNIFGFDPYWETLRWDVADRYVFERSGADGWKWFSWFEIFVLTYPTSSVEYLLVSWGGIENQACDCILFYAQLRRGDKTTLNRFMDRLRCCKDGHVFETVERMNEETLCSSTVEDSFVEVSPSIDLERFQYILDALFLPDSESVVAAETEPKKPRPPILKLSTNSAMKQEKNTTEKSSESVKEVSFEFPAEEEEEVLVEDEEEGREYDENDTSTSDDSYSILSIDDSDINDHPDDESEDGSQPPIQSATVPHEVIRPVEKNDAQDDDLSFEGNESGRWLNNNQPKMLQVVQVEQQVILPRSKSNEKRSEVVIDDRQMELVSQCKVESFTYDASVEDPFISDDEENENDQPSRFVETFVSSVQLKYYSSENPTDQSHLQTMHGDVQSGMISGGLLSDDDEYSAGDEAESERLIRSRRFNPADAAAKEKSSSSAALKYQIFVGGVEMERDFNSPLVGERPPSSVPGDSDEEEEEKKSQAQVYSPPMTRARAKKSEKSKNNPHAAAAADDGN
ncbi:Protein ELYS [Trichinella spiralis]|uniref:Protein ELYS n=1 Tax=Trichinella spiralis TaxID=6334 RepID=A0A0V1BWP6_TRISP|nr:Protein ELYS [Trichinella spiralis]